MQKYRATFTGLHNQKETAFEDEINIEAGDFEEASRIAMAFASGRSRDDRVEDFVLQKIYLV
jgi:hypothetical protein